MMTATQMIPAVGQEVFIQSDLGPVVCRVADVRNRFGSIDLRVMPADERGGGRFTWVSISRLCHGMKVSTMGMTRIN
jgi:hypothetical protein